MTRVRVAAAQCNLVVGDPLGVSIQRALAEVHDVAKRGRPAALDRGGEHLHVAAPAGRVGDEHHPDARVRYDMRQLGDAEAVVDRYGDGAELGRGEERQQIVDRVPHQQADAVMRPHPEAA